MPHQRERDRSRIDARSHQDTVKDHRAVTLDSGDERPYPRCPGVGDRLGLSAVHQGKELPLADLCLPR